MLERDTLPSELAHRAGKPQARDVHALVLSGQRALSELFPGFEQDLAWAGAVPLRAGLDVSVERPGLPGERPEDFETTLKFGIALTRLAAEDPAVHKLTIESNIY